jgi:hypothetical protein
VFEGRATVPAHNKCSKQFASFFTNLNPAATYEAAAARAHGEIRSLIEDPDGPAGALRIRSFLQGSYRRDTAIHTINDVDVVALCHVAYRPSANRATRDQIHDMVKLGIAASERYSKKIHHGPESICVKVVLKGVVVEVLPALYFPGQPLDVDPCYIFKDGQWVPAFARRHQELVSEKNAKTDGMFVPMIKVLKHLRSQSGRLAVSDAVSFHLECLLFAVADTVYSGSYGECIARVLTSLAGFTPQKAEQSGLRTPVRDKVLFAEDEWNIGAYSRFHPFVREWAAAANEANAEKDADIAAASWQALLREKYFPVNPSPS